MCFDSIHASAIAHNGLLQVLVCARYTCTVYSVHYSTTPDSVLKNNICFRSQCWNLKAKSEGRNAPDVCLPVL